MISPDFIILLTIQNIPQLEFRHETLKNVFFILVGFMKKNLNRCRDYRGGGEGERERGGGRVGRF
jgi:hypothetical protein